MAARSCRRCRASRSGPTSFRWSSASALCCCGLMIAFGIGHSFEEEEELESELEARHSRSPCVERSSIYGLRALLPPALLLFYVVGVERLGFILTAAIIVLRSRRRRSVRGSSSRIPLAILAPIGIHLIFYKLLRVPLPAGLIPMPW